jgi:hypothetical protein
LWKANKTSRLKSEQDNVAKSGMFYFLAGGLV